MTAKRIATFMALAALGAAQSAMAHHPPNFERCELFNVTGEITRVDWSNPHVALTVRSDEGETYELGWLNVRQLHLAGIERDRLHAGDRVAVAATRQADGRGLSLLQEIRRLTDDWKWMRDPQGC
jgi:hypothetical protein